MQWALALVLVAFVGAAVKTAVVVYLTPSTYWTIELVADWAGQIFGLSGLIGWLWWRVGRQDL